MQRALDQQRRRQAVEVHLASHRGTLDLERLIRRFPDHGSPAGRQLSRVVRQQGQYVQLSRTLGHGPAQSPALRLWPPLAWLERRVVGVLPFTLTAGTPAVRAGQSALLLPWPGGGLLLAEHGGRVHQFMHDPQLEGRWQPLEYASDLQTGPEAQADPQVLGLEPLPASWRQLTSARRAERVLRARLVTAAVFVALLLLLQALLIHAGLSSHLGLLPILAALLTVPVQRTLARWAGALPKGLDASLPAGSQSALERFRPAPDQRERLLSPDCRAVLASVRTALEQAERRFGTELVGPLRLELAGLLDDRFLYLRPDVALDAQLQQRLTALTTRLQQRTALADVRARDLAAERLRRDAVDPHF
ncbi:hypothetical protein [Deinococcus sonorensis]|uniref:Uncharacterized protein n=2 Tax=Deinococcus sonorensis TaxID=309891 RepID=A0AAU7U5U5_9DEIO